VTGFIAKQNGKVYGLSNMAASIEPMKAKT